MLRLIQIRRKSRVTGGRGRPRKMAATNVLSATGLSVLGGESPSATTQLPRPKTHPTYQIVFLVPGGRARLGFGLAAELQTQMRCPAKRDSALSP